MRAYGRTVECRPRNETFAEYLIRFVWLTMGEVWFKNQMATKDNRHVLLQWYEAFSKDVRGFTRTARTREGDDVFVGSVSGPAKSLVVLGYDFFSLRAKGSFPETLLKRLRSRKYFQATRYEIAVAAIFARLGFKLRFLDEGNVQAKHCEFVATDDAAGIAIAVEAKSRVRQGTYHQPGRFEYDKDEAGLFELVKKATKQGQATEEMPLVIFLELNVPLTPAIPVQQKPWFNDLNRVFDRADGRTGSDGLTDWSVVIATNFGLQFNEGGRRPTLPEVGLLRSKKARRPLHLDLVTELLDAVRRYGSVPEDA